MERIMKVLNLSLMFLITLLSACRQSTNINTKAPLIEPINSRGCLAQFAYNFQASAYLEDGSCIFKPYCDQEGYAEYAPEVDVYIKRYMEVYGEKTPEGEDRVTITCEDEKVYCPHPEAINFVDNPVYPPVGYKKEYCYFSACTKSDFYGHAKYLEYVEYLKEHEGEIIENNTPRSCGAQRFFKEKKDIKPDVETLYDKASISVLLDDSSSMSGEIESVKDALVNLSPILKDTGKDISISFHRLSDNAPESNNEQGNMYFNKKLNNGNYEYIYGLSEEIGKVEINKLKPLVEFKKEILVALDEFKINNGYGNEQGLCTTLKHLNDLVVKGMDEKTQYLSMLITDEDEHYKNDTKKCFERFEVEEKDNLKKKKEVKVFTDAQDNEYHIESFISKINLLSDLEKAAYGWIGIFYDKGQNNCKFKGQNSHGETYLDFSNNLDQYDVSHQVGDICATDYTQLIKDKLIKSFLEKVGYNYFLVEAKSITKIEKLVIKLKDGTDFVPGPLQYKLVELAGKHSIRFSEDLFDQLRTAQSIEVEFIYEK